MPCVESEVRVVSLGVVKSCLEVREAVDAAATAAMLQVVRMRCSDIKVQIIKDNIAERNIIATK